MHYLLNRTSPSLSIHKICNLIFTQVEWTHLDSITLLLDILSSPVAKYGSPRLKRDLVHVRKLRNLIKQLQIDPLNTVLLMNIIVLGHLFNFDQFNVVINPYASEINKTSFESVSKELGLSFESADYLNIIKSFNLSQIWDDFTAPYQGKLPHYFGSSHNIQSFLDICDGSIRSRLSLIQSGHFAAYWDLPWFGAINIPDRGAFGWSAHYENYFLNGSLLKL